MIAPFVAELHPDGAHFTMRRRLWSATMPIDRLDAQIALYEGLRDRKQVPADPKRNRPAQQGPYHHLYAGHVEALRKLKAQIRSMQDAKAKV